MHLRRSGLLLGFVCAIFGCSKNDANKTAPSASASVSASALAGSTSAAVSPSASASAGAATGKGGAFSGTYSLAPAAMYISDAKDFSNVKQAKDDPSKHVGEGAFTIEVDAHDHVTGTIDSGPASPALIDGTLMNGEIRGNVRRKTITDDGLTGTLIAKLTGDSGEGKMSLAEGNAAIVREGKLSLKKK